MYTIESVFTLCERGCRLFMVVVKAQPGETSDTLIRKFTRKVLTEGIIQDIKRKEFYVKPAEIRKEKKKELARKIRQGTRG